MRYLVTGATRGVGRGLIDALAGHELIALGRNADALSQLPVADTVVADLAEPDGVFDAVTTAGIDRLDGVVHCAGVARRATLEDSDAALWRAQLDVNVVSVAEVTRAVLPALRRAGGAVVFVNSGAGLTARANSTVYASTKFALRGMAQALREEEPDLRVTTVYPGRIDTEMQRALKQQEGEPYEPEHLLTVSSVVRAIVHVLDTPPDAVVADLTVMPRPRPSVP